MDLPDRRVRLEIFDSRTASLGTLEGFVTRAAEPREMRAKIRMVKEDINKGCKPHRRLMAAVWKSQG